MTRPALQIETGAQTAGEGSYEPIKGTPWENLGHPIPAGASVEEMLVAAELDWKVLRAQTVLRVECDDGETRSIVNPKAFGLVRSTDLTILSPFIGPRYKMIQNERAFEVFSEFVEAGQMTMETAGSFSNGQHVWGLAKTGHGFELADGERIESYFLLLQSHLYGFALKAMWTPIRYPGGHTLVQSINTKGLGGSIKQTYSLSHASKFTDKRIREIKELLGIAAQSMADFRGKAEFMQRMRVSTEDAIMYLIQVFDKELPERCAVAGKPVPTSFTDLLNCGQANRNIKKIANMLDRTFCKGGRTAWGCWSTVNEAFDHEMGHGDSTRLDSIWLGKNRDAKVEAFNLANILASAKGKAG